MENTVSLFRLVHRVALSTLLLLIATIPLIINVNMVTSYIILPVFLIFIFILSILIEQKLDILTLSKKSIKKRGHCSIVNFFHKKCHG